MSIDLLRADEVEQSIWSDTFTGREEWVSAAPRGHSTGGQEVWASGGLERGRESLTLNQRHFIMTTRAFAEDCDCIAYK